MGTVSRLSAHPDTRAPKGPHSWDPAHLEGLNPGYRGSLRPGYRESRSLGGPAPRPFSPKTPFKGGKGRGGTRQLGRFLSQLGIRLRRLGICLDRLDLCLSQLFQPAEGL